jgi:uncharacterized Rmd1/YagE family protein
MIDEVIYTPYVYDPTKSSESARNYAEAKSQLAGPMTGDLLGAPYLVAEDSAALPRKHKRNDIFSENPTEAEIFIFEYGTVVLWGMTEAEEKRFLSSLFVHPSSKSGIRRIYSALDAENVLRLIDWVSF